MNLDERTSSAEASLENAEQMRFEDRITPPGVSYGRNAGILFTAIMICVIISSSAENTIQSIKENALWGSPLTLQQVLDGEFICFWVFAALCVAIAVFNYRSFSVFSRSSYVRKRIRNPFEMHIMCLFVPVAALIVGLAAEILVMVCLRASYIQIKPYGNLPEYNSLDIWRALL